MNNFELFCLIFLALDAQWDETENKALGDYLSDANPFLFADIGSADAECYDAFCKTVNTDYTEIKESYKTAKLYIEKLGIPEVKEAFLKTDETGWLIAVKKYLSAPHKGEGE